MTTVEIDGLKDMIACNTRISSIIDDHLSYAGYDISEFMNNKASFESNLSAVEWSSSNANGTQVF